MSEIRYQPGPWLVVTRGEYVVFLDPAVNGVRVERVWGALSQQATFDDVVYAVTDLSAGQVGLQEMCAIVAVKGEQRALLRGEITLTWAASGRSLDGRDPELWNGVSLQEGGPFTLSSVASPVVGGSLALPLSDGVALASKVYGHAATLASASLNPEPRPVTEPHPAIEPDHAGAVERPEAVVLSGPEAVVLSGPDVQLLLPAREPGPPPLDDVVEEAAQPSDRFGINDLMDDALADTGAMPGRGRRAAPLTEESAVPEPLPAPGSPQEWEPPQPPLMPPGLPNRPPAAPAVAPGSPGAGVVPMDIPGPGFARGPQLPGQSLQGSPGILRLPDGGTVDLVGTIIIGRRPSAPAFPAGPEPRLVTVGSPQGDTSRSHVEVNVRGGVVTVTDLRTTNGTYIRQGSIPARRLEPGENVRIGNGDSVELGQDVVITFEMTS